MAELKDSIPYEDAAGHLAKFNDWDILGHSAQDNPIRYRIYQPGAPKTILVMAAIHGDETESAACLAGFIDEHEKGRAIPADLRLIVLPVANPDGFLNFTRGNGNGVDLNRNLPTKDWSQEARAPKYFPGKAAGSEPENHALMKLIEQEKPQLILSLHSWKPLYNVNGPSHRYAEAMQKVLNIEITEDIGYPTPGSLGTYCGFEREIPTITWELERGLTREEAYSWGRPALWACLEEFAES